MAARARSSSPPKAGTNGALAFQPAGPYQSGAKVKVIASPTPGFVVDHWTGTDDDTSKSPINHVTVTADITVSVTFAAATGGPFHLTLSDVTGGTLSAAPEEPSGGYAAGTVVALTATPASGYSIGAWTGTDDATATGSANQVTMTADETVGITFTPPTVTAGTALLTVTASGNLTASATSSTPVQTGPGYTPGSVVTVTATLGATGHKVIWTGTDDNSSTATTNTVTMGTDPVTVTATSACDTTCTLTVEVDSPPDGYVMVSELQSQQPFTPVTTSTALTAIEVRNPQGANSGETFVVLQAFDTPGWPFAGWSSPATKNGPCGGNLVFGANATDQKVVASFPLGGTQVCAAGR